MAAPSLTAAAQQSAMGVSLGQLTAATPNLMAASAVQQQQQQSAANTEGSTVTVSSGGVSWSTGGECQAVQTSVVTVKPRM